MKLRASQLNGCAFCVDPHSHRAKNGGEPDERLFSVVSWRESPFFSEAERSALALTDAATHFDAEGASDDVWNEAAAHYDDRQLAALVMTVATINAWNRIGVSTLPWASSRAAGGPHGMSADGGGFMLHLIALVRTWPVSGIATSSSTGTRGSPSSLRAHSGRDVTALAASRA